MENQGFGHDWMANSSCGLFWIANSVSATFIGANSRKRQLNQAEIDQQVQYELRELSILKDDELRQKNMAQERARLTLNRKYRLEELSQSFENILQGIEVEKFFNTLPIAKESIHLLLSEIGDYKGKESKMPLNILMLRCLQHRRIIDYRMAESRVEELCNDFDDKSDVKLLRDYCSANVNVEGNAHIFNLHAFMRQIPTVIISPCFEKHEKKILYNVALWEAQAARPLIRPVFQIDCDLDLIKNDNDERTYQKALQEKVETASICIVGCLKDSYMLMTRGVPPVFPSLLKTPKYNELRSKLYNEEYKEILWFLQREYEKTLQVIQNNETISDTYGQENVKYIENMLETSCQLICHI